MDGQALNNLSSVGDGQAYRFRATSDYLFISVLFVLFYVSVRYVFWNIRGRYRFYILAEADASFVASSNFSTVSLPLINEQKQAESKALPEPPSASINQPPQEDVQSISPCSSKLQDSHTVETMITERLEALVLDIEKKKRTVGFRRFNDLLPYNPNASPDVLWQRETRKISRELKEEAQTNVSKHIATTQRLEQWGSGGAVRDVLMTTPEGRLELKLRAKRENLKTTKLASENLCFNCKKTKAQSVCSHCRCAIYCSKKCQWAHWRSEHYYQCFHVVLVYAH